MDEGGIIIIKKKGRQFAEEQESDIKTPEREDAEQSILLVSLSKL